ncbi:MCE family protein [Mariniblastus fucicola]|uniref:Chromosome segregation protein n=1 Tax=Mariniblastus fucicola TaxID=980251 RepID=A0A5B9PEY5_9BACT|nr:MlaD family protein [Mariniblastus fucicola]QEG24099.1 chromosome segregation protein [Mariniblastus fucicola]
MDENVQKLRVGIYTIIVLLILAILIFLNGEGWNSNYSVFLKPVSAPGVRVGTPVRKNGILIGRVDDVRTENDHVVLRLAIRESERIYGNETISIGAESVLGDAGLEVLPLRQDLRGELVSHNSLVERYEVKPNPMELIQAALELEDDISMTLASIRETSETIGSAGTGIETLTSQVNAILTDDDSDIKKMVADIRQLSMKAEVAVDSVNGIFEQINATIQDPDFQEDMDEFVKTLPAIFKEVRVGISDFRKIINGFAGVGDKVNENLDNVTRFTDSLGETGPEVVEQINGGVKDIRALIEKAKGLEETIATIQETFGNKDGTVGQLFNNREAYDEALAAIRNVKEVTEEVKRVSTKLEPLMNDARHLVDKVARDPGGVIRGAMQRKPVGAGYKGTPGSRSLFR